MLSRIFLRRGAGRSRCFSTIKILDEKERAAEHLYFSKQDEVLLRRIFAEQKTTEAEIAEPTTAEDKVKLVFMKNGIPPSANPKLLKDLVDLLLSK